MRTLIIMKITQVVNLHTNLLITIMGNQNPGQAQEKVTKKHQIYFTLKVQKTLWTSLRIGIKFIPSIE